MMRTIQHRCALAAAALVLAACAELTYDNVEVKLPISPVACHFSFSMHHEAGGRVSIITGDNEQHFRLNLRARDSDPKLFISSDSGQLLYTVSCQGSHFNIRPAPEGAPVELPIPVSRLLVYLQLMTMPEEQVERSLRPGWRFETSEQRRSFLRLDEYLDVRREILLRYTGAIPNWDSSLLQDSRYPYRVKLEVDQRR